MRSIHIHLPALVSWAVLVAGILPAQAQTCAPAPAGLVGWWPGNNSVNDVVVGNNGRLAGDATFVPAVFAEGFKFDGVGDFVEIPDSAALRPAHMSVEAWVRFDSLDTPIVSTFGAVGTQYIVFKKNTRVFNFEAYALRKQREAGIDRLVFSIGDITGLGTLAVARSISPITVGPFYHVVGTYDGSYVRLYVNGVLEGEAPVSVAVDYDTRPVFIGTSGETVFDGKLNAVVDEASIYNRAIGPSEVSTLYQAGSAGKCSSVTGLLTSLASFVQALNLSNGISNSLDGKLQTMLQAIDAAQANDVISVCNRLVAFSNEASAQAGNAVMPEQATQLVGFAQNVRSTLQCRNSAGGRDRRR